MAIVGLPTVATLLDCVDQQRTAKLAVERRRVERTRAHERLINARDDAARDRARIVLAGCEEAVVQAANVFVVAEHGMYHAADYLRAAPRAPAAPQETARGCICPQDGATCWTCGGTPSIHCKPPSSTSGAPR